VREDWRGCDLGWLLPAPKWRGAAILHDDDAVMLLTLGAVSPLTGEMEAWFFASWVPAANVYPSCWHLMVAERDLLRHIADRR
jgi:hypothetical protein